MKIEVNNVQVPISVTPLELEVGEGLLFTTGNKLIRLADDVYIKIDSKRFGETAKFLKRAEVIVFDPGTRLPEGTAITITL